MDTQLRNRTLAVLKSLMSGQEVTIGSETYRMSTDYELCAVRQSTKGHTRYLRTGANLGNFVGLVEQMSEEDFVQIVFQNAYYKE